MAEQLKSSNISSFLVLQSLSYNLNSDTIAAVLSKMVEIVWFDHTDHGHLLQSCSRECPDIFSHSMVWIYHNEGKAQIEQT